MHDTNLPLTKRAYIFCTKTREYLGELDAYLSPLEGTYPLPSNVVFVEPGPDPGPRKARRLKQDGSAWEVIDDFRYIMLWDTSTAQPVSNALALGETPPAGTTHLPPPTFEVRDHKCAAWDTDLHAWIAAPDYSRSVLWTKASAQRALPLAPGSALPDTLTTQQPPRGDHICAVWNAARDDWDAVPDYRGQVYWTEDGMPHEITELGVEPPSPFSPTLPDLTTSALGKV